MQSIYTKLNPLPILALGVAMTTGSASAALIAGQSILLDFGNQQTVNSVAPPTNSNFINNDNLRSTLTEFTTGATVAVGLTQISGDTTAINFYNDDSGDIGSPNGNTGTGAAIPAPFNSAITEDWSGVVNGNSYDITFTGLNDLLTYNIVYIVGGFTNNTVTEGLSLEADGKSTALGSNSVDPKTATLTGLSTDGLGNLLIQIVEPGAPSGTEVAVISGLYLEAIPEPSSIALVGLSGIALLLRRRK